MTILTGEGEGPERAFVALAEAMLARLAGSDAVQIQEVREVRAHGATLPLLLEGFIEECLYVLEVEGFVGRRIEILVWSVGSGSGAEPLRLHARIHGEAVDPGRHRLLPGLSVQSGTATIGPEGGSMTRVSVSVDEICG